MSSKARLLFVTGALIAGTATAFAQTASAPATDKPAVQASRWIVTCSNQADQTVLACSMTQTLFATQGRSRIVSVVLQGRDRERVMTVALPHGLNLVKGLTVSIDGGAGVAHAIQTADASGAYVSLPVDAAMLKAMQRGKVLQLSVTAAAGQTIKFELTLNGFSDALALMK